MSLSKLIEKKYGFRTSVRINPLVSSVGTSKVKVLGNNPNRVGWKIINLSTNNLYVLPDEEVSTTKGIKAVAGGGFVGFNWEEDFDLTGWEVWGIADGASSNILVLEIEIIGESIPKELN